LAPASTSASLPWIEAQCAAATAYQEPLTKHLADVLGTDGVLVLQTTADTAPPIGESGENLERFRNRSIQMLCLAGLTGFPQVSLPLG
jgi:amidase